MYLPCTVKFCADQVNYFCSAIFYPPPEAVNITYWVGFPTFSYQGAASRPHINKNKQGLSCAMPSKMKQNNASSLLSLI